MPRLPRGWRAEKAESAENRRIRNCSPQRRRGAEDDKSKTERRVRCGCHVCLGVGAQRKQRAQRTEESGIVHRRDAEAQRMTRARRSAASGADATSASGLARRESRERREPKNPELFTAETPRRRG